MGLFEKAGRRFEQFKQQAKAAAEEEAEYECAACGSTVYTQQEQCPECGASEVVPVEPAEGGPASPGDDGTESGGEGGTETTDDGPSSPPEGDRQTTDADGTEPLGDDDPQ